MAATLNSCGGSKPVLSFTLMLMAGHLQTLQALVA